VAPKEFASYRIQRKLWERPDGLVCFLAEQVAFERTIELRLLGQDIAENSPPVQRFVREFKTLARLDHPSICPILDVGCSDGKIFYTTTHRAAPTLASLLSSGRLSREPDSLVSIATQLSGALAHMHEHKVIHRNLKLDSVRYDSNTRQYYIDDFEMVRPTDRPSLTARGCLAAHVSVEAPEASSDGTFDERADQFMLGMLLISLALDEDLAASNPSVYFNEDLRRDTLERVTSSDLPHSLVSFLTRLCATSPDERYGDFDAVAKVLESLTAAVQAIKATEETIERSEQSADGQWAAGVEKTQQAQRQALRKDPVPPKWHDWIRPVGMACLIMTLGYFATYDWLGFLVSLQDNDIAGFVIITPKSVTASFSHNRSYLANKVLPTEDFDDYAIAYTRYLLLKAACAERAPKLASFEVIKKLALRDRKAAAHKLRGLYLAFETNEASPSQTSAPTSTTSTGSPQ